VLYLDRSGAQQLNKLHAVSHEVRSRELLEAPQVYQVTARASLPDGRYTDSIGAVNIGGLKGEAFANAIMKAETKAKRRATLDLLGLGMMDETEVETIPGATVAPAPITEAAPDTPAFDERYYRPTNDHELVMQLVNEATHSSQLRNLLGANVALFSTNPDLKAIVIEKGKLLKSQEN
jgi:hypothetical protein